MNARALAASLLFLGVFTLSCAEKQLAMKPATTLHRDVFTCKGLSADNRWVGVTDVFLPEENSRVVVVANFAPVDLEGWVIYELTNPFGNVVLQEEIQYPKNNPLGIYFEIHDLLKLGGEGEWKANVYSDDVVIGQQIFYLGEKPEDDFAPDTGFRVIGAEPALDETAPEEDQARRSAEDRFADYIREVTPSTPAPSSENSIPSYEQIDTATP